jgi:hypothetical protein
MLRMYSVICYMYVTYVHESLTVTCHSVGGFLLLSLSALGALERLMSMCVFCSMSVRVCALVLVLHRVCSYIGLGVKLSKRVSWHTGPSDCHQLPRRRSQQHWSHAYLSGHTFVSSDASMHVCVCGGCQGKFKIVDTVI